MSDLLVIKTVEDIEKLELGQQFVVDLEGLPDDPIDLIESDVWAETLKLETAALNRFGRPTEDGADGPAETENGDAENGGLGHPKEEDGREESEEVEGGGPAESDDVVSVSFSESHVTIKAISDIEIALGGDVRDAKLSLTKGKSTRRKLTGEGHGWVSVNDQKFEVPE